MQVGTSSGQREGKKRERQRADDSRHWCARCMIYGQRVRAARLPPSDTAQRDQPNRSRSQQFLQVFILHIPIFNYDPI